MSPYRIFVSDNFEKSLRRLARGALPKIERKLREYVYSQLSKEPHFGLNIKKLSGWNPPTWRYRVGDWRFFYEIDEAQRIIFMTAIESRGAAY